LPITDLKVKYIDKRIDVAALQYVPWLCLFIQPTEASHQSQYNIQIFIKETKKVGDGMNAYMTYKVVTKVGACVVSVRNYCRM